MESKYREPVERYGFKSSMVQNVTARFVLRRHRKAWVVDLLKDCGWLSVNHLVIYHFLLLLRKITRTERNSILLSNMTEMQDHRWSTVPGGTGSQ